MKNMNGKDIDPSIMKQYSQGEGFDDQSTDTAQKKEASVGVKKPSSALPADDNTLDKDYPKAGKNGVDGKVFSMADERDY
jgi:hypothetical protein|tara:strand:- start:2170 stop:2409 length:240 start_codon:yes stop_codon:yes gene_type:complete